MRVRLFVYPFIFSVLILFANSQAQQPLHVGPLLGYGTGPIPRHCPQLGEHLEETRGLPYSAGNGPNYQGRGCNEAVAHQEQSYSAASKMTEQNELPLAIDLSSFNELNVEDLNILIGSLIADPLTAALSVIDIPDAPIVSITRQDTASSTTPESAVTITAQGWEDGAIQGRLTRLIFRRFKDGRWSVTAALEAVQCHGDDIGSFIAGPCP